LRSELEIEQAVGIDRTGQLDLAVRNLLEADAGIIRLIPDKDDEVVAKGLRLIEAGMHQGAPDADILALRMNGQRPQQQRVASRFADLERPETDRPRKPEARIAGDEREPFDGDIAFAQPVGGFGRTAEAEGEIEQMFDGWMICGQCRFNIDAGHDGSGI